MRCQVEVLANTGELKDELVFLSAAVKQFVGKRELKPRWHIGPRAVIPASHKAACTLKIFIRDMKGGFFMPAFKYKTEEGHQKHLAYRREWYQRNKDRINQQKRLRRATKKAEQGSEKPPAAKKSHKRPGKPQMVTLNSNPQLAEIMQAIQDESTGKT